MIATVDPHKTLSRDLILLTMCQQWRGQALSAHTASPATSALLGSEDSVASVYPHWLERCLQAHVDVATLEVSASWLSVAVCHANTSAAMRRVTGLSAAVICGRRLQATVMLLGMVTMPCQLLPPPSACEFKCFITPLANVLVFHPASIVKIALSQALFKDVIILLLQSLRCKILCLLKFNNPLLGYKSLQKSRA